MNLHDPRLTAAGRQEAAPVRRPGADHVAILMGVRNGAAFLGRQLDSLVEQTHRDWSLVVGDDRSEDGSADIVHCFAAAHPGHSIRLVPGPHAGFQRNFLGLLDKVPDAARYVAFADQDDVWLPEKLARAVRALGTGDAALPQLYGTRTIVTDANLAAKGRSRIFERPPSFRNALVQSIAGGNTMVMNRSAADLLRRARPPGDEIVSHDWWAYQVVSGVGGRVFYDANPSLLYRQHGKNLVGSGLGLRAKARRARALFAGDLRRYTTVNIAALAGIRELLTEECRDDLDRLLALRGAGPLTRLKAFRASGLHRQTRAGNAALWAAVALGRL
ncbi:MAG: glycosyltransferase [Paracoccaceae bacterium]|nr:glycosyltransferase [Paracoccaceae bacterium]